MRQRLLISGRVQGVGYRASAAGQGRGLGLRGWVRNLRDGRVEALVEGPEADVEAFVAWCRRGPPAARVDDVDRSPATGDDPLGPFDVRPTP